jgi:hypothetical protein
MRMRRTLPSPAMVVALVALAVALGGTTYAAVELNRHSVGTKQLKNAAVKKPKIAAGAVTTAKIAANAIDGGKIADGSITRAKAAPGTLLAAYGAISNLGGAPSINPGSVNINDLDVVGGDGTGNLLVTFSNLPNNTIAGCAITVQPFVPANGSLSPLIGSQATVKPFEPGQFGADTIQVQTLNAAGTPSDLNYFIQVACPPA